MAITPIRGALPRVAALTANRSICRSGALGRSRTECCDLTSIVMTTPSATLSLVVAGTTNWSLFRPRALCAASVLACTLAISCAGCLFSLNCQQLTNSTREKYYSCKIGDIEETGREPKKERRVSSLRRSRSSLFRIDPPSHMHSLVVAPPPAARVNRLYLLNHGYPSTGIHTCI